jgi:hypothetical protein
MHNHNYVEEILYSSLNPWFVTGLIEAEGSFYVRKDNRRSYSFQSHFRIEKLNRVLSPAKLAHGLLLEIQNFFGCGYITINTKKETSIYSVSDIHFLNTNILSHLNKFPLRGTKYLDYLDFSQIIKLLLENRRLDKSNLNIKTKNVETILSIISNMNRSAERESF